MPSSRALLPFAGLIGSLLLAPACVADGGAAEAERGNDVADDSYDPPAQEALDPSFDDGLAASLDLDPAALAPTEPAADGDRSGESLPPSTAQCASTAKTGVYCGGDKVTGGLPGTLYHCDGPGAAKAIAACSAGCVIAPAGSDDYCKAAPKPTCASTAKTGDYCGNDKVLNGSPNTLYRCTGPGSAATVVRTCAAGCVIAPSGSDDFCKTTSTSAPSSAAADACPHVASVLRWGLHPIASDRLRCAGVSAARISQTIGYATASAGTHAQDGVADGHAYSAATDLSVAGLSDAQVRALLVRLDALGFAAFFRNPGHDGWPSPEARHVHAVFAGARMKSSLRAQIEDFLAGRNGLASHATYGFYQPPSPVKAYVKQIFLASN
jgi:hypothetical protein